MKRSFSLFVFVLLVGVGFLLYFNTLHSPFQYDDRLSIQKDTAIRDLNVGGIFKTFNTRFLPGLTLAVNFWLGGLDPFGYRVLSIFFHILAAFFVFHLTRLTFRTPYFQKAGMPPHPQLVALGAALIFLTHPIETEAVNFLTQRSALLAGMFYLLTVTLYAKARIESSKICFWGAWASTVAAMFCKEITFTLPLTLALYEICFFGPLHHERSKRILTLLPFLLTLVIIPITLSRTSMETIYTSRVAHVTGDRGESGVRETPKVDITRTYMPMSRHDYFLTQLNVLVTYLRLLVLPVNQNLDYDYPISRSLAEPKTLVCGLGLAFLLAGGTMLYRRFRLMAFGIFWFFIVLSVESSIIPIGHMIAEYRLYSAVGGFALFMAFAIAWLLKEPRPLLLAYVVFIIGLSVLTFSRNQVWRDEISLWQDTLHKSPGKVRPYVNLGLAYAERGQLEQAVPYFEKSLRFDPDSTLVNLNLGAVYAQKGETDKAIGLLKRVIEKEPNAVDAYLNLGAIYGGRKDFDQEIALYRKALAIDPGIEEIYINLGIAYKEKGDRDNALKAADALRQLKRPDLADRLEAFIRTAP